MEQFDSSLSCYVARGAPISSFRFVRAYRCYTQYGKRLACARARATQCRRRRCFRSPPSDETRKSAVTSSMGNVTFRDCDCCALCLACLVARTVRCTVLWCLCVRARSPVRAPRSTATHTFAHTQRHIAERARKKAYYIY